MRWARRGSSGAIKQVIGGSFIFVAILIISLGWLSDSLLNLFFYYVGTGVLIKGLDFSYSFITLLFSIFLLVTVYLFARYYVYSDSFSARSEDENKKNREVILVNLSPHVQWNKKGEDNSKGYDLELLKQKIDVMPTIDEKSVLELAATDYQCNWVPLLKAIENYKGIKEVVAFTTMRENGDKGSNEDFECFRDYVVRYFSNSKREVSVKSYLEMSLESVDVLNDYPEGIPASNLAEYARVVLKVLDRVAMRYRGKVDPGNKIAIDVTGGTSALTAVMAAVSVSQGIFIHYTDTHTLESKELDITTQ